MECKYFGLCGGCALHSLSYQEQLKSKIDTQKERFISFWDKEFDIITSDEVNFRYRAEFRIYKDGDDISYSMNSIGKSRGIVQIDKCGIVSKDIDSIMPKLLDKIKKSDILKYKLFTIEFLNSTTNDMLVTLIYHKKLDNLWVEKAKELEKILNIKIIGRSRGQKLVLSQDYISESLDINNNQYKFEYKEGGFTQPNTGVNIKMIDWVLKHIPIQKDKDLCELYCGGGNFTIPLSSKFRKVLATEISKTSIKSAKRNVELNNIDNISFIRMSSEEFVEAQNRVREFQRLKDANIQLDSFDFSTIFVDPPRAGLDNTTVDLVKKFDNIIYISCNPITLKENLEQLVSTHTIENFAFFDQFVYTNHIECGVLLKKIF
jgi:tRNA (uracil-5-)-methyltransferase